MSAVAIIPARGGSKALPRKNVLPLAGQPLIAWTIQAAQAAKEITRVVVSTDDAEIGAVAKRYGAEVVWRPAAISGDLASSEAALLHALETHLADQPPEIIAFLQCTSPLTSGGDIDGTIHTLLTTDADTAVAVQDFHYFVWKSDDEGNFVGVNHDKSERKMRQERHPQYLETGAVYVMRSEGLRKHRHRFFGKTAKYVVPPENVLEIDDAVDFTIASVLFEERLKKQRRQSLPKNIDVVVFDFDGVFTNDLVHVLEDGTEAVTCSRSDGMGVKLAKQAGIPLLILSSEKNSVVKRRADKLNVDVMSGVEDKATVLDAWLKKNALCWENTVFVGNDVNDTECLKKSGCGVVVANASLPARRASNLILQNRGGNHAVRELLDLILTTPKYQYSSHAHI